MNVTFIVFNRPDTTEAVFNAIRRAKPDKLFVIADAPRPNNKLDFERCEVVRKIVENINWKCQVYRNYAEENMGPDRRIPTGISWVFEHVHDSIILEDDCLPHPSFFPYCSALLERYRDDERIMAVSGDNLPWGIGRGDFSYYFSKYFHCWGWATWARAWRYFEQFAGEWPKFRDAGGLDCWCPDVKERVHWNIIFDREHGKAIPGWDFCYMFSCWAQSGLTILPKVNLISNIGWAPGATHAVDAACWQSNIPTKDIGELRHPPFVVRNERADNYDLKHARYRGELPTRVGWKWKVAKLLGLHQDLP